MADTLFPAISAELDFIARHEEEANAVWFKEISVNERVKRISDKVYQRAEEDAQELLEDVSAAIDEGAAKHVRIAWNKFNKEWKIEGRIFRIGQKSRLGSVGCHFVCHPDGGTLVLWAWPPGGAGGRRRVQQICAGKLPDLHIHLASANPKLSWSGSDDAVVWFEKKLSTKDHIESIQEEIRYSANGFFKTVAPVLRDLAA